MTMRPMRAFRDLSIRRKLTLIVMFTSSVALLIASLAFVVYDTLTFRDRMVGELTVVAEGVGINSSAALAFEVEGARGMPAFDAAVNAYAQFHWDHMRKEEERLMPLAEKQLTEADWRWIEDAFAGNRDPIADLRERDFEQLYQRIVNLAPAPVGLGESHRKIDRGMVGHFEPENLRGADQQNGLRARRIGGKSLFQETGEQITQGA